MMDKRRSRAVQRRALKALNALLAATSMTGAALAAEPAPAPVPVTIKAFDCTPPCEVTLYDADGLALRKITAPKVGENGVPGLANGKGFIRIELDGHPVYVSRRDVRLNKHLAATNPGQVLCTPQTGTMGSGC